MPQLTTITDKVSEYTSSTTDNLEIAERKLHIEMDGTRNNYYEIGDEVDLYYMTIRYKSYMDEIIIELNARETATIDGGTF